jgi:hypothetical protein
MSVSMSRGSAALLWLLIAAVGQVSCQTKERLVPVRPDFPAEGLVQLVHGRAPQGWGTVLEDRSGWGNHGIWRTPFSPLRFLAPPLGFDPAAAFTVAIEYQVPTSLPEEGVAVWGLDDADLFLVATAEGEAVHMGHRAISPPLDLGLAKQVEWGHVRRLILVHAEGAAHIDVWSPDDGGALHRESQFSWESGVTDAPVTGPPGMVQNNWFRLLGQAIWNRALDPAERQGPAAHVFSLPEPIALLPPGPELEILEAYETRSDGVRLCCRGNLESGTERVRIELMDLVTAEARDIGVRPLHAEDDWTGGSDGIAITGLLPDRPYVAQVYPGDGERWGRPRSVRFRTAPAPAAPTPGFTFAVGSCMGGMGKLRDGKRTGDHPIYRDMLRHDPQFYLDLGDDPYADSGRQAAELPLDLYRQEYQIQARTPTRQLVAPHLPRIKAGWDDHEILDNFSNGEWSFGKRQFWPRPLLPPDAGIPRLYGIDPDHPPSRVYLDARRALLEYNPIARSDPDRPERLYRRVPWGKDVEFFFLDTRSYRAQNNLPDQDPGEYDRKPVKTMLGVEQRDWLIQEVRTSRARWKIITSGVPLQKDTQDRDATGVYVNSPDDTWLNPALNCSFGAEREYIFSQLREVPGILILTGDQHISQFHALPMGGGRFYHLTVGPGGRAKGRYVRLDTDEEQPAPGRLFSLMGWGGLPGTTSTGTWEPPLSYATVTYMPETGAIALRIFSTHDIRVTPPAMVYAAVLRPEDLLTSPPSASGSGALQ